MANIKVTIWNEYLHEIANPQVAGIYPAGIHGAISAGIRNDEFVIGTATLQEPEHGLTEEVLSRTDVLIWWGHMAHDKVADEIVERVYMRVMDNPEILRVIANAVKWAKPVATATPVYGPTAPLEAIGEKP